MSDVLPTETNLRKDVPLATGVIDYFPDALVAVAELSKIGNDKHNPGEPLHWSRGKSNDHPDCLMRHFVDRGKIDTDGVRHSVKVAWRALAILQLELEGTAADESTEFRVGDRVCLDQKAIAWWRGVSGVDDAAQKAIEGDDRWADDGGPVPESKAPNFKVGDRVRCTCRGCLSYGGLNQVAGIVTSINVVGSVLRVDSGKLIYVDEAVIDQADVRLAA